MNLYVVNYHRPEAIGDTYMVIVVADDPDQARYQADQEMAAEIAAGQQFDSITEYDITKPVKIFDGF